MKKQTLSQTFSLGTSGGYQRDGPGRHDLEVGLARLPDPVGHGVADGLKPVHGDHHQHVRAESKIECLSRRFSFSSIRCKHNFGWQHMARNERCIVLIDKTYFDLRKTQQAIIRDQ